MILNVLKNRLQKFVLIASLIGPGLITAFADNDAAGVATFSSAAAKYGYLSLIILIPVTIVLYVTQEIGSRLAIVGKKGLADLIREHYGVRISVFVFITLFLVNFGPVLQNISGLKSSLEIFGLSPIWYLPLVVTMLIVFIIKTPYKIFERFFLILIVFYGAFIFSAFMAKPNWQIAISGLFIPAGKISIDFLFVSMAMLGTTVTAWGQFYLNSAMVEKKADIKHQKYTKLEIIIGSILTNIISFFIVVAVAATIFSKGLSIEGAKDAALSLEPFAGQYATLLFGGGLFVASIVGAVVVPLSTAYAFSELFGLKRSLDEPLSKSKPFYAMFGIQLIFGLLVTLFPAVSLFQITMVASFLNAVVLPLVLFFLYKFGNNSSILGGHKNTITQNMLLIVSCVLIIAGSVISIINEIFKF